MALCEAAAYYRSIGCTLWDAMVAMYEKYGYYKDSVRSITLAGIEGLQKIQDIINGLRENPPAEIGGYKVLAFRDYKTGKIKDTATGAEKETGLPASNVLYFDLEEDAWVCVRPSGTEPKLKLYYGIKGKTEADAEAIAERMGKALAELA
jgi:phosphoglucomutase